MINKLFSFFSNCANSLMYPSSFKTVLIFSGSSYNPSIIALLLSVLLILSSLKTNAIITNAINWEVNAFVDATAISGPALIWTPQWVSLLMVDPTTLVTPTHKAPLSKQYLNANIVSAVSPL
eukprot:NODE_5_length_49639_cov_0.484336.p26 type:complete len:122 gc:universal NODE_5_length_49639_cov_0.484336:48797-48432(-)